VAAATLFLSIDYRQISFNRKLCSELGEITIGTDPKQEWLDRASKVPPELMFLKPPASGPKTASLNKKETQKNESTRGG
jgi:hypothetical protein